MLSGRTGDCLKTPATLFAISTLVPVPLIAASAIWGGWTLLVTLLYLTVFVFALDELVHVTATDTYADTEFPASDALTIILAFAYFALLPLVVWAICANPALGWAEQIALFFAAGVFFGQISNANAHELIHRTNRFQFNLGVWIYISLLFGHHASAHRLVHHIHVASDQDPNSARLNESFYHFAWRAWIGSFKRGFQAEAQRQRKSGINPYFQYIAGSCFIMLLVLFAGGATAVAVYMALAAQATSQLLMSDYVQHYGLRRGIAPDGKPAPVDMRHSWNAPHWFSRHMMLNAPRHSDHHAHPGRKFPELVQPKTAPVLPYSLPVMGALALFPRAFRKIMNPKVAAIGADAIKAP